jgi:hypothetical protein
MMLRRLSYALLGSLNIVQAYAGSSIVTVQDAGGATHTFVVITNASGQFGGVAAICDGVALATCAIVNGSGLLGVFLGNGTGVIGTVSALQSGNWTVGLGAGTNAIGTATALQGGAPWSQNITQVGGSTVTLGQATMASSIPVVLPSNQTVTVSGTTTISNVNANGSAVMSASSPVVIAQDQKLPWTGNFDGAAATAGEMIGCQAATGEFSTLATNGTMSPWLCGLEGKPVFLPYSVKENMIRATASTITTSATNLGVAPGSGLKNYITDLECWRLDTGTTAVALTFNDSATTVLILPNTSGGGEYFKNFETPLVSATTNATFTFSVGSSISTVGCSMQGYKGS